MLAAILVCWTGVAVGNAAAAKETPESLDAALERYEEGTNAILGLLAEEAPAPALVAQARALTELSRLLAGEFAVAYPPCGPYLGAALGVLGVLGEISPAEIERSYHADAALPEAPGWCYHAKDLIVHPATVIVLARTDGDAERRQMRAEIDEVRTHLEAVRRLFDLAAQERPSSRRDGAGADLAKRPLDLF